MLQDQYKELDAADKIGLIDVAHNDILHRLIDQEIGAVKEQLCTLTPSGVLVVEYAITQQRLISLQDLRDFLKRVRQAIDTTPQPEAE